MTSGHDIPSSNQFRESTILYFLQVHTRLFQPPTHKSRQSNFGSLTLYSYTCHVKSLKPQEYLHIVDIFMECQIVKLESLDIPAYAFCVVISQNGNHVVLYLHFRAPIVYFIKGRSL